MTLIEGYSFIWCGRNTTTKIYNKV